MIEDDSDSDGGPDEAVQTVDEVGYDEKSKVEMHAEIRDDDEGPMTIYAIQD
jgi:hypothetical protein